MDSKSSSRPTYFDRHVSSTAPPLPTSPVPSGTPGSPRTPLYGRSISGNLLNSPGSLFRTDDEVHVLELGARYLRVGFGGEAQPRATMAFGPDTALRQGDYSIWLPGQGSEMLRKRRRRPRQEEPGSWGMDYALYPLDMRGCDLGLVSDKLMRALREAAISHLLVIDDKRRGLVLAVPSLLPHPLLSTVLHTLFSQFPNPQQITLLSTPICATIAAGLRNAVVVDIGFHETVITAVVELKEIGSRRSERGMRRLNWEVGKLLVREGHAKNVEKSSGVTFEDCEEVIWRMGWCQKRRPAQRSSVSTDKSEEDSQITVSLPSHTSAETLSIPFFHFSHPVEATFFTASTSSQVSLDALPSQHDDDNLQPLPELIHALLLSLPLDARAVLLPHILFTGGGSHIPNLRSRVLSDLTDLISSRAWDPVTNYGSATNRTAPTIASARVRKTAQKTEGPVVVPQTQTDTQSPPQPAIAPRNKDMHLDTRTPASQQPPLPDPILARIHRSDATGTTDKETSNSPTSPSTTASQTPKAVHTLGSWPGASLLTGLRQRGVVEISRDAFLAHGGLASADRDGEATREREDRRVSVLAGREGKGVGDRGSGSWVLGAWA